MKSTKAGNALTNLIESEDLTNEQMALDLHVDPTLISKMRNDKRNMVTDFATRSMDYGDNEFYNMEVTREFTNGSTAPRVNGDGIDYENHLAVLLKTKDEMKEALDSLNIDLFLKRPELASKDDLNGIDTFIKELKESAWWSQNLIASLSESYQRSAKKLNDDVTRSWKASEVIR